MPSRQAAPTITIKTAEVMGDDSWIKLRRPDTRAKERAEESERLEQMGVTFDAAGHPSGGAFSPAEISRMGVLRIAESLVDWNWVDFDGRDLPKPDPANAEATAEMLLENLREVEIDYLIVLLKEFNEQPANLKKSGHSSKR